MPYLSLTCCNMKHTLWLSLIWVFVYMSETWLDGFICCYGMNPFKGGVWCQRISQTPFDSQEQVYLNKAKILHRNPSNLLIPIYVFGLRGSSILLICFCLSECCRRPLDRVTHSEIRRSHMVCGMMTDMLKRECSFILKVHLLIHCVSQQFNSYVNWRDDLEYWQVKTNFHT